MKIRAYLEKELSTCDIQIPRSKTLIDVIDLFIKGVRNSGWNSHTAGRFMKKFEEYKPYENSLTWFLADRGRKLCPACQEAKELKAFSKNKSEKSGLRAQCKSCDAKFFQENREKYAARNAKYRSAKLSRTPKWANMHTIDLFYSNCPKGNHVDHIIPLQGEKVSGLHVENNLQYLTAYDNLSKGNKYDI